ncbi:MAG TPA: sensor histidine kinase [Clostridiaceae bacterium]|nr:sensor histidine kinase [Clostridiaceae bacterium]
MKFKKLTITKQLTITAFLIITAVISVFAFAYKKASDIMVDKNKKYSTEITSKIKHNIDLYYQEVTNILYNIGYDINTQDYLTASNPEKSYDLSKNLIYMSINMMVIKKDIIDIVIISENGSYFTMEGEYNTVLSLKGQIPDDRKVHNTGFVELTSLNNEGVIAIMYGMYINSAYNEDILGRKIGFAAVLVDVNPIFDEISRVTDNTELKYYLIDKNGNIYSKNDPLGISGNRELIENIINDFENNDIKDTYEINGSRNIVLVDEIPIIQGRIISFMPEKELFAEIDQLRRIVMIVLMVTLISMSVLFFLITNNITRPVKKLISFMDDLKGGSIRDLKKEVQLEGYFEITVLSKEFNSMLREINNLTHRLFETSSKLYETEIEKEKSELAFLRSQINPHFLYNTLEVIKGIALDEGAEKLYEMTNALALVFRYSVKGSNTVQLGEELKIIKAYVHIHLIRFGERLEAEYQIEEETLNVKVPKMILQPVVENAFFHGLEAKRGKGRLTIGSSINGRTLRIWIKDDGVGIEEDKLAEIRSKLSGSAADSRLNSGRDGRIGLFNVNNRIKLTYGAEYGLSIYSEPSKGTEVVILLPAGDEENV